MNNEQTVEELLKNFDIDPNLIPSDERIKEIETLPNGKTRAYEIYKETGKLIYERIYDEHYTYIQWMINYKDQEKRHYTKDTLSIDLGEKQNIIVNKPFMARVYIDTYSKDWSKGNRRYFLPKRYEDDPINQWWCNFKSYNFNERMPEPFSNEYRVVCSQRLIDPLTHVEVMDIYKDALSKREETHRRIRGENIILHENVFDGWSH